MVEVEIGGVRAVAEGYQWTSGDARLLRTLRGNAAVFGWAAYEPFPALTLARDAVSRYGGRIVRQQPPEYAPGRVY